MQVLRRALFMVKTFFLVFYSGKSIVKILICVLFNRLTTLSIPLNELSIVHMQYFACYKVITDDCNPSFSSILFNSPN